MTLFNILSVILSIYYQRLFSNFLDWVLFVTHIHTQTQTPTPPGVFGGGGDED